ncbi:MAG: LysM peptidoglycan-binding domain-containing protein [Bacteriovoracaceae bacterium]|nr:LysM peptidoglycan-binding domain-containing protein [Bacteriovoracaceae bacterium]
MKLYLNIRKFILGLTFILSAAQPWDVLGELPIRQKNYLNCLGISGFAEAYKSDFLCKKFGIKTISSNKNTSNIVSVNKHYSSTAHPNNPHRMMYGVAAETKVFDDKDNTVRCSIKSNVTLDSQNKKVVALNFQATNGDRNEDFFDFLELDKTHFANIKKICHSQNILNEMGREVCQNFFDTFRDAIYQQALLESGNFTSDKSLCLNNHTGLSIAGLNGRNILADSGSTKKGDLDPVGAFGSLQDFFEAYIRMIYTPFFKTSVDERSQNLKLDSPNSKFFHGLCILIADQNSEVELSTEEMCAAVSHCQYNFQKDYSPFVKKNQAGTRWYLNESAPDCENPTSRKIVETKVVTKSSDGYISYTVAQGETLYGIAKSRCEDFQSQNFNSLGECINLRIDKIRQANDLKSDSTIKVGQNLKIPSH